MVKATIVVGAKVRHPSTGGLLEVESLYFNGKRAYCVSPEGRRIAVAIESLTYVSAPVLDKSKVEGEGDGLVAAAEQAGALRLQENGHQAQMASRRVTVNCAFCGVAKQINRSTYEYKKNGNFFCNTKHYWAYDKQKRLALKTTAAAPPGDEFEVLETPEETVSIILETRGQVAQTLHGLRGKLVDLRQKLTEQIEAVEIVILLVEADLEAKA